MDKGEFRILLAILGVMLVAGIYLWDRIKTRRSDPMDGLIDAPEPDEDDAFSMVASEGNDTAEEDDLPSFHAYSSDDENNLDVESSVDDANVVDDSGPTNLGTGDHHSDDQLEIVQLYVIAHGDMLFPGQALVEAFEAQELEYGDMKIYHRSIPNSQFPRFSVVNMVEPGTFPDGDYSNFQSPGIALFLQPAMVDHPQDAFDDMVQTGAALAARLRGEFLDASRNPANLEVIQKLRNALAE